jgi:hypothetical protein
MESNIEKLLQDKPPKTDFWLLFKVSSLNRLKQMQKGLLYMNSLEYFSSLKDEENLALRVDELEKVQGILRAGHTDKGFGKITVNLGDERGYIDLGPHAFIKSEFPRPQNTMIFCMGALADGQNGIIPGEVDDTIIFDEKFLEFGSHLLLISKPMEFSNRINKAIENESGVFGSKHFHGSIGLVDYKPMHKYSGPIGIYTKDIAYAWQMEFRLCFGFENHCLNSKGAYELNIGDISDISDIVPVQALIDEPLKIKRRTFQKNGDIFQEVNS